MRTRMNTNSLDTNAKLKKSTAKEKIYNVICVNCEIGRVLDYKEIMKETGLCQATVSARLNDLKYIDQKIKVVNIFENGMDCFAPRLETDPLNERPDSKFEKLVKFIKKQANKDLFCMIEMQNVLNYANTL